MLRSPPSRRRGLKFIQIHKMHTLYNVASFAEAWIEISKAFFAFDVGVVASFAEAWIEILLMT